MAGFEEEGGQEEGVVSVQGVHQGEVGGVLVDVGGQVWELGQDDIAQLALG